MEHPYWQKQDPSKPLFPDIEWNKPLQKKLAGKLLIVGGNAHGFAAVAEAYTAAEMAGVGEVQVVLPDVLKRKLPAMLSAVFLPTNPSGGMSKEGSDQLLAALTWAEGVLLVGDAGRNSETAMLYEQTTLKYSGPLTITRDAFDLLSSSYAQLAKRPGTVLILSFAQLQILFKRLYYPKPLLFSMQLTQLVEALHKFTITYPLTVAVLHQDQLVVATGGRVSTTSWNNPATIWRGLTAARAATYLLWESNKPFEAVTASLCLPNASNPT